MFSTILYATNQFCHVKPNGDGRTNLVEANGLIYRDPNSVAETHVGKTKPRKKAKPWMTPHVRAKIRIRNQLRRTINTNRQEWKNACREANEAINEAKTDCWKEVLEDAMTNTNNRDMWKVIKGLNSPNEAMSQHGRVITDAKVKANIFVNHYA